MIIMEIRIPRLGEGADSGVVVNILVKEGDLVKKDQTILELENEKAVAPIPSSEAGRVTKIYVKVGDKVSVGQPILSLGADSGAGQPAAVSQSAPQPQVSSAVSFAQTPPAPAAAPQGDYQYQSPSGAPPPAAPSVRKIARDLGLDLTKIRGSQAGGRIILADLKNYIQNLQRQVLTVSQGTGAAQKPALPAESIDFSQWGPVTKKAVSSLRQKIAQKMTQSWTTIPHVTQFDEADITALMELRKKYLPKYEKKKAALTLTSFILKAVVYALQKYPLFNSSLDEASQEIVTKNYVHLGVAVDTEAGLIVPVLKDADKKDLLKISLELASLAEKTRQRKVGLDDLKGGTFTISNLGGIGGTYFTPIINKPEVAILGVGRGALKPVIQKSKQGKETTQTRLLLPLAVSYDHRVIDGADGARFIRAVIEVLENFKEEDVKI
jgi:pyruvate dehydrogenase E2 component (dihydrolipoamide acetyltransferase)